MQQTNHAADDHTTVVLDQLSALLDWLSFTVPTEDGLDDLTAIFGPLGDPSYRLRGYSQTASILGTGAVGWSPQRPELGVHVQLPATALSNLRMARPELESGERLLDAVLAISGRIRRLDVAFDDRGGQLSMQVIRQCAADGLLVSRWRRICIFECVRGGIGSTLYCGDRSSETALRIYDKQAEVRGKGGDDPGCWVRAELQLRGDRAHAVAERYVAEGPGFAAGILRGLIDFKVAGRGPNRSRWKSASWWSAFLGFAEKATLSLSREARSLDRTRSWLEAQVAPSLAAVVIADGGSTDFVHGLIRDGSSRLPPDLAEVLAHLNDTASV